ncbi:hypothetical protein TRFO_27437 [Tritrichomonas foetus]|uniref:Uncharacterized protein n=1 Tax=Tritrichomonas foetus TaxID=1144522 RepID=A0A1J4K0I4_9EUKA|nr:hypothetical protein TRFO_27437 [Tritrichomonas foetus]|eukprot:OHT04937.1 hypothetical protein TRFO_27437 [Tritrichomonas foetus]
MHVIITYIISDFIELWLFFNEEKHLFVNFFMIFRLYKNVCRTFYDKIDLNDLYHSFSWIMSNRRLPGQRDDEDEETYMARVMKRVEERLAQESKQVPERFSEITRAPTLTIEHPVFRTTNHDYGMMDVTQYERPTEYHTVSRRFTEKEHLGANFEGANFNI